MKKQTIFFNDNTEKWIKTLPKGRVLLVCGKSFQKLSVKEDFSHLDVVQFSGFSPNPRYEEIAEGIKLFLRENCAAIAAVGGGSAIDTAKCIKAFANSDLTKNAFEQEIKAADVPLLAVPTTAGSGSESTQFAVFYSNGEKQSISHESILPDIVLLKPELLNTLPEYQRKATFFDALGQAIESIWAVSATEESRTIAAEALKIIWENRYGYLKNTKEGNIGLMRGANLAGQAINLTKTTAPHAMSYKMTTNFSVAHGHAVGLCLPKVWRAMADNLTLENAFCIIAAAMGTANLEEAVAAVEDLLREQNLSLKEYASEEQLELLAGSVNTERLSNNPVRFSKEELKEIYRKVFCG